MPNLILDWKLYTTCQTTLYMSSYTLHKTIATYQAVHYMAIYTIHGKNRSYTLHVKLYTLHVKLNTTYQAIYYMSSYTLHIKLNSICQATHAHTARQTGQLCYNTTKIVEKYPLAFERV